ncbi:uncharacterized protein SOCE836_028350 [Sorangium cellulosum]|uniref:ATP-dependent helicase HrpA n=1 Tax=Sorangium cellulosum TaxID=56 RepID=A0A4P2QL28_SORCE|nr:uncharacterized protein SOCE836_028350 [Sorangium cellulosum]
MAAIERSTDRAELLRRTFAIDVLECPACKGRMKLVAMVTEPRNIVRFSPRSASRPMFQHALPASTRRPPYWICGDRER